MGRERRDRLDLEGFSGPLADFMPFFSCANRKGEMRLSVKRCRTFTLAHYRKCGFRYEFSRTLNFLGNKVQRMPLSFVYFHGKRVYLFLDSSKTAAIARNGRRNFLPLGQHPSLMPLQAA